MTGVKICGEGGGFISNQIDFYHIFTAAKTHFVAPKIVS